MIRSLERERSLTIEAGKPRSGLLGEAWEHRELLSMLAWRDVAVRYKQTFLGVAWAVLRPLLMTLVFVVVFAIIVRAPSPDAPYGVLVLSGLVLWQLIHGTISGASESLLSNASMLSKVYFPRMLFPLSASAVPLVDFLVGLVLVGALMIWHGITPTWRIVFLPGIVALALLTALGAGLWLSAAIVRYRDLRHVVPFMLQAGLYASPVAYPSSLVPDRWQLVYALNPAVGLIDAVRWALLGQSFLNLPALAISIVAAVAMVSLGIAYFRQVERGLVDVL
jgi:lipopolysaccharide transport system permease protein